MAVALLTLLMASPSFALSGLGFLAKSPIAYFTPEDSRLFKNTLYDVLNSQPDGKIVKWMNQKTGHSGKMKSTRTFVQNGLTCRRVNLFNSAGGVTGQGKFNFCKQEDGSWKIPA
jgi:surface antigen